MSEAMKGKYEVIRLIRGNVLQGLGAFGLPVGKDGWECIEADQAKLLKRDDKVVTLELRNSSRVGWQSTNSYSYNKETGKLDESESWIEQQEWLLQVLMKRTTAPVTAETVEASDVAMMLMTWFNNNGCAYFRKHGCANLFVRSRDLKTYKDSSDLSQIVSSVPLKLQVPKTFRFQVNPAEVEFGGLVGIPPSNEFVLPGGK